MIHLITRKNTEETSMQQKLIKHAGRTGESIKERYDKITFHDKQKHEQVRKNGPRGPCLNLTDMHEYIHRHNSTNRRRLSI